MLGGAEGGPPAWFLDRHGEPPPLAGPVKNTYIYKSYAAFASDLAAGRLPAAVHAVLYDIEKWPATPLDEQQHPQVYMRRFSALARAHGLLPILCGLASADEGAAALVVRSQAEEFNVAAYRRFLSVVARQARAGNPRIAVLAQLATAPLCQPASVPQMVAAARSVRGLAQGFSLTARPGDVATTAGLLWAFGRPGRSR